ncbi:heparinase [Chitinophaga alhagiae]|uniref:Heparinase n=1 Tax=Chitinophaga alhagiae TaxID=2203219 RepID=A0ABM6WE71_9BACT|nr:heparinase II/III family protein [Chitinophaga alhagiae]AWO02230.1 heparinase [Chitinophaga alhagiae]
MIKKLCGSALVCLLTCLLAHAQHDSVGPSVKMPGHPRILWLQGEEKNVKQTLHGDAIWQKVHNSILAECDALQSVPALERKVIGRRLLGVSRECLRRVFFLSYAWRMTGNKQYMQRAEKELLAVSRFSDWNPSHFLDVAEMTMAVAIGYDWLHNALPAASKNIIREAILKKGIAPSLEPRNSGWLRVSNNWNQVCNAGMLYGALAIYESEPELALQIINRGIRSIDLPMEDYHPDGAYPEGYGYWGYGTSFNVLFISAVEKLFGKDFGLVSKPGFLQTADYLEHVTGAWGDSFNYSDAGGGGGVQPAMFWFAARRKQPSLLWVERSRLESEKSTRHVRNRLLPALMLWGNGISMKSVAPPAATFWTGNGKSPVALMRTSWTDSLAIYVGLKAGSPAVNHAHMDVGSFIMEADGVRWGMDFGMQDYNSLEQKGVKIWDKGQYAQRWQVFRYNNFAHSTLTINDSLQRVKGNAPITRYSDKPAFMHAICDLSGVYDGQLQKATRGIAVVNKEYVVVRDEVEAPAKATKLRWTLLTPANVKITGSKTAELTKNGKKLLLKVDAPLNVQMKTWTTTPPHDYDAPNPGTVLTGFEVDLPPGYKGSFTVVLAPGGDQNKTYDLPGALANWP